MTTKLTKAQAAVLKRLAAGERINFDTDGFYRFSGSNEEISNRRLHTLVQRGLVVRGHGRMMIWYGITDAGRTAIAQTGEGEG